MSINILIIGDEGRLRDSLRTILLSFLEVDEVSAVTNIDKAQKVIAQNSISLVIIDSSDLLEDKCQALKQIFNQYGSIPCVVIANSMEQRHYSQNIGADAVLIQGFSTDQIHETLTRLLPLSKPYANWTPSLVKPAHIKGTPPKQTTSPY